MHLSYYYYCVAQQHRSKPAPDMGETVVSLERERKRRREEEKREAIEARKAARERQRAEKMRQREMDKAVKKVGHRP